MTTQEILQGVHDWTNGKIVYDISVAHPDGQGNPTKYADLTAALGTGGANIPEALRKGGMSVKFVLSSDNKYVQYRLMATSFSTTESDWVQFNVVGIKEADTNADIGISDSNGNVILKLEDGHIKTKNFNSETDGKVKLLSDYSEADLEISDLKGNIILRLEDGHIKTKNFNSQDVSPIEQLEDIVVGRKLIWHDEFNKGTLDDTKWSYQFGKGANNSFYTDNLKKNLSFEDNALNYYMLHDYQLEDCPRSSLFLHTNRKFEFRYGLIEAKIKFPDAPVYHSTFWTMGANLEYTNPENISGTYTRDKGVLFQTCGEIDIAECDNKQVTAAFHWASDENNTPAHASGGTLVADGSTNWHIYGCEWTQDTIKIYVDRVLKHTFNTSVAQVGNYNPYHLPHHLILNSIPALDGTPIWESVKTQVQWVRVYAPTGIEDEIKETAITFTNTEITIPVGGKQYNPVSFTPDNTTDKTLNYISSNEDIADIYGGMIHGISVGTTYVKAYSKTGISTYCKVNVINQ